MLIVFTEALMEELAWDLDDDVHPTLVMSLSHYSFHF